MNTDRGRELALGIIAFAVLGALLGALLTRHYAADQLGGYLIQLVATFIGALLAVAIGLYLFHYQDRTNDEKLEENLGTRVAIESQMNLGLLESKPSLLMDERSGQKVEEPVVLVMLSNAALTDLIRSNLLEPDSAMRAMNREGTINTHNAQMKALLDARSAGISSQAFQALSSDVARRQEDLRNGFRSMVETLRDQGIEVPSYAEA